MHTCTPTKYRLQFYFYSVLFIFIWIVLGYQLVYIHSYTLKYTQLPSTLEYLDRNPTQKEIHQRTGIAETPVNIDRGRAASPPESTIYLWVFYQSYYSLNVVFIGFIWYLSWVSFLCLLIVPTRESTYWELISLEKTTSPLSDNFTKIESAMQKTLQILNCQVNRGAPLTCLCKWVHSQH